ncbi:hypothetical protein B484DRAFT_404622 [Ochromonadaceae sp. CCMP2298]|nr:hypothetical protein B484DRAFT_404622 [Ochromonadaceae sp. CCMP2298]
MKQLYISDGSSEGVKTVLRDILKAKGEGVKYNENGGQKRKGSKALIVDGTPQASVVPLFGWAIETEVKVRNPASDASSLGGIRVRVRVRVREYI